MAPKFKPMILATVTAIAALATSALAAPPASAPTPAEGAAMAERGNGTMGMFTGAGGDPVAGQAFYQQKCASCHDTPSGRTPPKATIAANTPTMIMSTLLNLFFIPVLYLIIEGWRERGKAPAAVPAESAT